LQRAAEETAARARACMPTDMRATGRAGERAGSVQLVDGRVLGAAARAPDRVEACAGACCGFLCLRVFRQWRYHWGFDSVGDNYEFVAACARMAGEFKEKNSKATENKYKGVCRR